MDSARFDRLTRTLSTRRVAVGGGIGALLAVIGGVDEAGAKPKKCGKGKKRCGKTCIPRRKLCCPTSKKVCGKTCIPKSSLCCGPGQKSCGNSCILAGQCCTHADCGDLYLCASGTCVIGQGICPANADCSVSGGQNCSVANPGSCGCYLTTTGVTRCGDTRILEPGFNACINDAQCAARHPTIPGVFCTRGAPGTLGRGCPGENFCQAPCRG